MFRASWIIVILWAFLKTDGKMKRLCIALLAIISSSLFFVSGLSAARKETKQVTPDWYAMTRGEHIAWLSLTPDTKPLVRQYMQKEFLKLDKRFPGSVAALRDSLIACITLPSSRVFVPNDTILSDEGNIFLKELSKIFSGKDDFRIVISVFTANSGSSAHIARFSQQRADAAAVELQRILGDKSVVIPFGMGDTEPIAKNNTYQGREENRRIEVWLIPSVSLIEKLTGK